MRKLLLLALFAYINMQTLTSNTQGKLDGYDYTLWKDSGNTKMVLLGGSSFSCEWSSINNALFRTGITYGCKQSWDSYGTIVLNYDVDYNPNGNSYLCVYGWTRNPLVEYYIVEAWGSWRPPGSTSKGKISVDGGTYDIYQTTRVNQPSIDGDTTFEQYWSVRTDKKTSGTITVSSHFQAWSKNGMKLGTLYEVALNIEGYQSSGSATVKKNVITVGGSGGSAATTTTTTNTGNNNNNNQSWNTGNTGGSSGNVSQELKWCLDYCAQNSAAGTQDRKWCEDYCYQQNP